MIGSICRLQVIGLSRVGYKYVWELLVTGTAGRASPTDALGTPRRLSDEDHGPTDSVKRRKLFGKGVLKWVNTGTKNGLKGCLHIVQFQACMFWGSSTTTPVFE